MHLIREKLLPDRLRKLPVAILLQLQWQQQKRTR